MKEGLPERSVHKSNMEIRKGPYGYFAVRKLSCEEKIFEYAVEVIGASVIDHLLPVYLMDSGSIKEVSFDFSGMISLTEFKKNSKEDSILTKKMRTAAGDFFCFLAKCPDHLIIPSNLILDPRFVFTDPNEVLIKVCLIPTSDDISDCSLRSLPKDSMEELFNSEFFSSVLSRDEIQSVFYAIECDDEEMLYDIGKRIRSSVVHVSSDSSGIPAELIYSGIFAAGGIAALTLGIPPAQIMFPAAGLLCMAKLSWEQHKKNNKVKKDASRRLSEQRKQILFDPSDQKSQKMERLILSYIDRRTEEIKKSAVYTNNALIGSDRFLSDICIDDPTVSPIHAEISRIDSGFYVKDLSSDNATFLENRRLEADRNYEIKNDQVLRCGEIELAIKI